MIPKRRDGPQTRHHFDSWLYWPPSGLVLRFVFKHDAIKLQFTGGPAGEGSGCKEEQGIKPPSGSRLQLQSSDHLRVNRKETVVDV